MKREQRKAAVAAYWERKAKAGIHAVVCHATGQRGIGRAADLDDITMSATRCCRGSGSPYLR